MAPKKRVTRVADEEEEEVDQDEGDDGLKRAKVSSDEVNDEEEEGQKETIFSADDDEGQCGEEEEEEKDDEVQLSASLQHVSAVAAAQEHEKGGEKDKEEDEEEVLDISALLEKAKLNVEFVSKMLKEMEQTKGKALQIEVPTVEVPNLVRASEDAGKRLLLDEENLVKCLCSDTDELNVVEQWGALVKWWRLVNRCLSISGIFAHLRAEKHGTLRDRYEKMVASLKSKQKVYSHTQAAVYDRLGKFLLEYPRFVYQLQWVSLADWSKVIKILGDRLAIDKDSSTYWKIYPSKAPVDNGCQNCRQDGDNLWQHWQCYICNIFFHEQCLGYRPGAICADITLLNGVDLEGMVYCRECLSEWGQTADDMAAANEEVRTVGGYLMAPECMFEFKKVRKDGYCCFQILEDAARKQLKWKGSQDQFCKDVAKAAVKVAREAKESSFEELKNLATQRKPVAALLHDGLWEKLDVRYILQGFVNMFPNRVVVNVYQATQGQVRNSTSYGSGKLHVNMLHWKIMRHVDSLVAKPNVVQG